MTHSLLNILSARDIGWMIAVGEQREIAANSILVDPAQLSDSVILLLEGTIALEMPSLSSTEPPLSLQRSPGTLLGSLATLNGWALPAIARTCTPAQIIAIPTALLDEKIQQDPTFAAHLYSAIAHLLIQQLYLLSRCSPEANHSLYPFQIRDASTVFAELQDHDLDWLVSVGEIQSLRAEEHVMTYGIPIDALHVVLEGSVALGIPEEHRSTLFHAFTPHGSGNVVEMGRRSRGDVIGEFLLLQDGVSMFSIEALRDTELLSIPRWRLSTKLLYDPEFATRVYRMLVALLANKQQEILKTLGYSCAIHELNHTVLNQVAIAEARFEWMVKRIQAQVSAGRSRSW